METWLAHHWMMITGGGVGILPVLRACKALRVRHLVLKGDSWTFEFRASK